MIQFTAFPELHNADQDGLLAMGGDLSVNTLVSAYSQGIFPWFNEGQPILWWAPDPRLVLYPNQFKISRSLKRNIKNKYDVTCNRAFSEIISGCALRGGPEINATELDALDNSPNTHLDDEPQETTWITKAMHQAYIELHNTGYAHSIETWQDGELVGGLYGVCLGKVFFGESMFSRKPDASKAALAYLCQHLANQEFKLIDCQVASEHLFSLGAIEIPRSEFIAALNDIDINQPNLGFSKNFPDNPTDLTHYFS